MLIQRVTAVRWFRMPLSSGPCLAMGMRVRGKSSSSRQMVWCMDVVHARRELRRLPPDGH